MFENNLKVLTAKNPELAQKLKELNITEISKKIEVFEADSKDIIISYNGELLHDQKDPVREAMFTWNKNVRSELKAKDIQIVFGLGLGYLFKRAYINSTSRIYLYEPFIEVLRFILEYVDFSKEFSDDRVFITNNLDELFEKLANEYLQGDKVEFLFLNSYAKLATDELMLLTAKALEICEGRSVDQNTIFNLCKTWTKNSITNIKSYEKAMPAGYLADKLTEKPALILASGPSLAENFELIKENREKFVVIAVGQAIKFLQEQNFIPDFMAFADAEKMFTLVDGFNDFKADQEYLKQNNMLVSSRADNHLFTKEFKSKTLYYTRTDEIGRWIKDSSKDELGLYESGGTVAIMCYAFAKVLGCKKIIFTGLDLAFINNKIYAHGTELKVNEKGEIDLGYTTPITKKLVIVKDKEGNNIPSRDDYASFIRHFEDIFSKKTENETIINTSLKGAYIKGMEYINLEEAIKEVELNNIDINSIIKTVSEDNNQRWNKALINIKESFSSQKQELIDIENSSKIIYDELKQICTMFGNKELQNNLLQAKIENIKLEMSETRDKVIKNVFLSNYLQGELLDYTKKYKMAILPRLEDIKHNMFLEKDLFETFIKACEELIGLIETV
ncbi:MAG: 6-hydroxymethylpterin diphosphokinase MptE-like protein [bacterium]